MKLMMTALTTILMLGTTFATWAQSPPGGRGITVEDAGTQKSDDATGTIIVLNKGAASASLIDIEGEREVARINVGTGPHEVAVAPDGATAVVTNYGQKEPGHTLTVINVAEKKATRTIELGEYHRPHGIAFLPDGAHLVVTAEAEKKLLIVSLENQDEPVVAAIPTNGEVSHMVALSPDAKRAYVANIGSDSISVIDLESKAHLKTIPTGSQAEGIAVAPDGSEIWVSNRRDDTISVIAAESLEVTNTLACEGFPIRLQFTPDGSKVLVSAAGKGDVVVFDAATKDLIKRIDLKIQTSQQKTDDGRMFTGAFGESSVPIGLLVHPNGAVAYVASSMADRLTILDLDSLERTGHILTAKEPDGLGYSPERLRTIPPGGPTLER